MRTQDGSLLSFKRGLLNRHALHRVVGVEVEEHRLKEGGVGSGEVDGELCDIVTEVDHSAVQLWIIIDHSGDRVRGAQGVLTCALIDLNLNVANLDQGAGGDDAVVDGGASDSESVRANVDAYGWWVGEAPHIADVSHKEIVAIADLIAAIVSLIPEERELAVLSGGDGVCDEGLSADEAGDSVEDGGGLSGEAIFNEMIDQAATIGGNKLGIVGSAVFKEQNEGDVFALSEDGALDAHGVPGDETGGEGPIGGGSGLGGAVIEGALSGAAA